MTHSLLGLTLTSLMLTSACGGSAAKPAGTLEEAEERPLRLAFQGLCDAGEMSESDDAWGASDAFNSHAHAYLHDLAAKISRIDREATAEILEAKQRLEAVLNTPDEADPAELAGLFEDLRAEVGDAAEVAGLDRPTCEGGSGS